MCIIPKIETPAVRRIASPASEAARRESEQEIALRRARNGVGADILISPLGVPG